MRKTHILFAAASVALIGLTGMSHAAPAPNSPPPSGSTAKTGNGDETKSAQPAIRRQQQQRPFYCFGDAACEREMARQGRAVADPGNKRRDENEGPYIQGIPGQTDVPGFSDTPVPVVPGK